MLSSKLTEISFSRLLSQANFESYVRMLDSYGVIEGEDREKLARTGARDPAKRREEKIRHYRWEKEVREKLEVSFVSFSSFSPLL